MKVIKSGRIDGSGISYDILINDNGEVYGNTLNGYFKIANSYDEYALMSTSAIERMMNKEEQESAQRMFELWGPSGGR